MAVSSLREAVVELLDVVDRNGGYMSGQDQAVVADARMLIVSGEQRVRMTTVRCETKTCPSRLELAGDWSARDAAAIASGMTWWTDGLTHLCPACKER